MLNQTGMIVDIAAAFIELWFCFVFCGVLLKNDKFYCHKTYFKIAAVILTIISEALTILEKYSGIKGIAICLLLISVQCCIYRTQYLKIVIATASYMLVVALIDYIVVLFSSCVTRQPLIVFEKFSLYRSVSCVCAKIILILVVSFLQKILEKRFSFSKKQMVGILLSNVLILGIAMYIFEMFLQMGKIEKWNIVIFLLLLLIVIFQFFYNLKNAEVLESRKKMQFLNLYNHVLENSLDEKQKNFEVWSKKIHDYKHHVVCMLELSKQKKYAELEEYLEDQVAQLKSLSAGIRTGYPGIDAILNSKQVLADSYHLHMICNIRISQQLSVDDMQMASILGNLLDNAIRAGKEIKESNVEVGIVEQRGNLQIKVRNVCKENTISFDKTTKKNATWHGVGLKSVQATVKELGGEFIIQKTDNMVTAVVVLFDVCR